MKTNSFFLSLSIAIAFMVAGCQGPATTKYEDTPTTGETKIGADETFGPICDAEIDVFEGIYRFAAIDAKYGSENETFKALLNDSVRMIIASRKLRADEEEYFKSKKLFPRHILLAADGVALIVNSKSRDTMISVSQLKDIVTGKVSKWNELGYTKTNANIQVVFDNPGSSTVRYIMDSVARGQKLSANLSALQYNKDVVEYVANHPNSMGVIGVNWVSDHEDSTCLSFLKKVKVMRVSRDSKAIIGNCYQPYQAYIARGNYPLVRYIYAINVEPRQGLASGFVAFLASDRGQRIILKSGIMPATQPIRLVEVRDEI